MQEHVFEEVWKEERERLARDSAAAADRARVALMRHAAAIGCEPADADRFVMLFEHIGRGHDVEHACSLTGATVADVDRWHAMADAYAAAAADRQVATDPAIYRDHDRMLGRIDPEPFDPTWNRPRRITGQGVTVRGSRIGTVVGGRGTTAAERRAARLAGAPIVERLSYRDCLAMADHFFLMDESFHRFDLIGTDLFSWHQVVAHKPERIVTTAGSLFAQRPEGAGRSIIGTARPARRLPMRRTTIPRVTLRVPVGTVELENGGTRVVTEPWSIIGEPEVIVNDSWPMADWRIRKAYGTNFDGGTVHPWRGWLRPVRVSKWEPAIGRSKKYAADLRHRNMADGRPADPIEPATVRRATVRRTVPVTVADVATAITSATATMADVHGTDQSVTVAYRTADGTTVTVRHEPEHRRYRVTVAHRHGAGATDRATSTVRSVATIGTTAGRMARKMRPAT